MKKIDFIDYDWDEVGSELLKRLTAKVNEIIAELNQESEKYSCLECKAKRNHFDFCSQYKRLTQPEEKE